MGNPKGFLKIKRSNTSYRAVCERVKDYKEVSHVRKEEVSKEQASRCMDCGTPFCHWGCPVGNYIPEWNDHMFNKNWKHAFQVLDDTNNLPEITGRICPAVCEYACVLGINDDPVTIRENELAIIEYAFKKRLIKPHPPKIRTGKRVAVIGSGPAGLSCAAELNKRGHRVVVFEKDNKIGGILRYGIPDFKLEKWIIDRRVNLWKKEGIKFKTNINVGVDMKISKLKKEFDAVCVTGGSRVPRDLNIKGRNLRGICFAMDYLIQSNKVVAGEKIPKNKLINTKGKKVLVVGGGDTGSDCVGTAHRQGASCVVQVELLEKPPECRSQSQPWPEYPMTLKTSSSHQEGGKRHWQIFTKEFIGEKGIIKKVSCVRVEFFKRDKNGCSTMKEVAASEFEIEADLVILAIGFVHPEHTGLIEELGLELDKRGNVRASEENYATSKKGIFSAGDMRRGQSLVVWAIAEGRCAARSISEYLE